MAQGRASACWLQRDRLKMNGVVEYHPCLALLWVDAPLYREMEVACPVRPPRVSYELGMRTVSMTWMTPLDAMTSVAITLALLTRTPAASAEMLTG